MCVEQANQNSFYQNIASNLLGTLSRSCRWCLSFRLGFGLSRSLGSFCVLLTSGPFGRPYRAGVRSSRPLPLALMLSKKRPRGINIESTYDKDWRAEKGVKHGGQFQDRYPVYNEIKNILELCTVHVVPASGTHCTWATPQGNLWWLYWGRVVHRYLF